jgi:phage/conjugal plasmid C-4 type zinc finger TraR family protein
MLKELEIKKRSIRAILVSSDRLPGYVKLKLNRVIPQLERAMRKVRENSYGICDDCDAVIPQKRLDVVQGATRCLQCQILSERSQS